MKFSLREMLFWVAVIAVGVAATQWMKYGLGIFVHFVLVLLILSHLETFLPQHIVVMIAILFLIVGFLLVLITRVYEPWFAD